MDQKKISLEQQAKLYSQRYVIRQYNKHKPMSQDQRQQFLNLLATAFYKDHPLIQYLQIPHQDIYKQYYEEIFTKHDEFFFITIEDKDNNNKIVGGGMSQDSIYLNNNNIVKTDYAQNNMKQELDYELLGYYHDFDKKDRTPGVESYLIRLFVDRSIQKLRIAQVLLALGFLDLIKKGYTKSMNIAYNKITQHLMALYNPSDVSKIDLSSKEFNGNKPFETLKQHIVVLDYDFSDLKTRETICKIFQKVQGQYYVENYQEVYKDFIEQTLQEYQKMNYYPQNYYDSNTIRPLL